LVLLSAALAMVLWGTRVREYPTFPVTESLHSLPNAATNDDAKKLAANTYLAVRDGIWKINEQRASNLRITGMLLLAGFLMSVIGQLGLGLKFQ
jgi:HAMP domain-containing protein